MNNFFESNKEGEGFVNGDVILRQYKTPKGCIEVSAEVSIEGDILHFKNVSIFPQNVRKLNIGNLELIRIREQLAEETRAAGYSILRITGRRVSGATFDGTLNSGRKIDITVDLTQQEKTDD